MAALGLVNYYQQLREAFGAGWMLWLGLAVLALLFTGLWRVNDTRRPGSPRQREYVSLLAICAFTTLVAYFTAQVVFGLLRHPVISKGAEPHFSDTDITLISAFAPAAGWAIGVTLLWRARAQTVVGYTLKQSLPGLADGFLGFLLAMPVVAATIFLTQEIWTHYTHAPPTEHQLLKAMNDTHSQWIKVLGVVAAVVIAPLFEELLFRGFIQGSLRRLFNSRIIGVFITSAMFALIHDTWTIPPIFMLALFLGFAYERRQNLWTSITMHALFNLFNIIVTQMSAK